MDSYTYGAGAHESTNLASLGIGCGMGHRALRLADKITKPGVWKESPQLRLGSCAARNQLKVLPRYEKGSGERPKDCAQPQHDQRHKEEAQVPANANASLRGRARIVSDGVAAANRELCRSVDGLLVVLALEADQLRRARRPSTV